MSGKKATVYDQQTENGCIARSGMGYYVPLDKFLSIEAKNNSLKEALKKEKSKNAYIETTGKSLKAIWSDGIIDAVDKLCPDFDYQESNDSTISVNALIKYSIELAHQ